MRQLEGQCQLAGQVQAADGWHFVSRRGGIALTITG